MFTQEGSNYRLVPDSNIGELAYEVYKRILDNTKHIPPHFCTLCKKGDVKHYHGSDIGKCFRCVQYTKLLPIEKEYDPTKLMFLRDGHHNENVLIELLSHSFVTHSHNEEFIYEENVIINNKEIKVVIANHPDLLITLGNGSGSDLLIEFKSPKDWFFKNIAMKGLLPKVYYGQTQSYLRATKINYGLLLVKNRHTSELLPPFIIPRNDEFFNQRMQYLATIQYLNQYENPVIVPRENEKTWDECKFCSYFKICWEK